MYLYTDAGKTEVQKYTTLGSSEYYFLFDKDCGVFGGKMFVETADALYETGDINKCTHSAAINTTKTRYFRTIFAREYLCTRQLQQTKYHQRRQRFY